MEKFKKSKWVISLGALFGFTQVASATTFQQFLSQSMHNGYRVETSGKMSNGAEARVTFLRGSRYYSLKVSPSISAAADLNIFHFFSQSELAAQIGPNAKIQFKVDGDRIITLCFGSNEALARIEEHKMNSDFVQTLTF